LVGGHRQFTGVALPPLHQVLPNVFRQNPDEKSVEENVGVGGKEGLHQHIEVSCSPVAEGGDVQHAEALLERRNVEVVEQSSFEMKIGCRGIGGDGPGEVPDGDESLLWQGPDDVNVRHVRSGRNTVNGKFSLRVLKPANRVVGPEAGKIEAGRFGGTALRDGVHCRSGGHSGDIRRMFLHVRSENVC
jgi:hypothetical protein